MLRISWLFVSLDISSKINLVVKMGETYMYDEGKSISMLSDIFERTQGAIRSRLKKLGKIQ